MTSCTADHRSKLRQLLVATFKNHDVSTPFDFTKFIKDFYEKAKLRTGDEFLAFEMAKLLPRLASQVLSTDAAQQTPIEGDLTLAGKMEKDINLGNLYPLMKRYENNTEVQKDLGLDIDPNKAIQAAQDVADGDKQIDTPVQSAQTAVKQVLENPFKTIPFGAFFSYGPELIQWTDPNEPGYMEPRPGQKRNYAALRYIDAVMRRQIDAKGIQDSSEMELPGVGKVFLKIVHTGELTNTFKNAFPEEKFNRGELVALVVDENGNQIMFSEDGKPDPDGKPVFFRPYASIARTADGGVAFTKEEFDDFFKRTGIKAHGGYTGSFNSIKQKVKSIAKEKRKADPSLTEEQAVKQAQEELNNDFDTFFKMSDYLIKTPGSSVQGVITGAAQGFIVHNEYIPTPLSEIYAEGTFFPSVKGSQTQATYPGVDEPVILHNPSIASRKPLLNKILSLFTDELFVTNKAGEKERMSVFERNRLINQFLLKYTKLQFMAKKDKNNQLTFENFDGSYDININGKYFNIKFDGTPEAQQMQKEVRAEIEKFLNTPTKGIQYTAGFKTEEEARKTLKESPGANIVTDLANAKEGSILKEGDKYYKINMPTLIAVGEFINKTYDDPTIGPDNVVSLEEKDYNEFLRSNWETTAVAVNGAVKKLNPTIAYGITTDGASKFLTPTEAEVIPEEEVKPETKAEVKPNTEATQSNIADMSSDDLLNAIKLEKKARQKAANEKLTSEDLKAHEEAARKWWKASPLSNVIPFEVMYAVINTENPTGPVAEWSVNGIILYHYYSENGKFDQSKSADYTDLYHEAWHGFTQTFLTQEQRDKLYAEVRNRSGSFVDYNGKLTTFKEADVWQLEEFLAEEFREYMMSGGKKVIKGAPQRNTIFRKLLNMLKALFKGSSVTDVAEDPLSNNMVKTMYENLRVGDLSAYNFDINNRDKTIGKLNKALVARTTVEGSPSMLNYDQSMLLVNTMDSLISQIVDSQNKTNNTSAYTSQLMGNAKNRKFVYELVKRQLKDKVIPALREEQEKETNPILKNQIGERIKLVEWAIEQYGDTQDISKNKDGKGLIAYHAAKSKYLSTEDKIALLEEEAEDENPEEEGMASKENKFGSSGNEVSQYDLATPEVKYLLRSILKFDEKSQPVKNTLGVQELNEASVMWNKIVRTIGGVMSMTEMYKKLDKAAATDPALRQLLNKLGPVKANGSAAETDLWINFWKTFNMVNIPLVQMTMEEFTEGGVTSYTMKIGAANTASRQALNLWRNSFLSLNTDYIKTDSQNRNYLDVKKVLADFTDLETGKLKADKEFEFLRAIGLRLTDKGAIRESIKKGTGNAPVLFQKLRRLADENGRNITELRSLDELFKSYPEEKDKNLKEERGDEGNLKDLAELETRNSDFASNYSVTNANGNMQFEQSMHNSMSIMVNTINLTEDVRDEEGNVIQTAYAALINMPSMKHLDIDKNPFAASSVWLNSVFQLYDITGKPYPKETFGQRRIIDGKPVELKLSNLSGVQMVGENTTTGTDSAGADEFTKLIMDFHMQTIANKPELMRHADKGTSYAVWLTNTFGTGGTGGRYADIVNFYNTGTAQNPNIKAYTDMHKVIKRYIDAEVKRMAKMRQMKESVKKGDKVQYDANYINEGQKMLIFESILSPNTKTMLANASSLEDAMSKNPNLDSLIRNDIEAYFEGQVTDLENLMKKNSTKFIDKNLILETQNKARAKNISDYTKTSTEKALFRAFVLNNWTHHVESMNIIYGDIAQYNMAKEEFHKRNAGAGSTGNLFATDIEIINYVNNKGRLYAKSQNITEKKLDPNGSYDSAVLADNEIPSAYFDEIKEGIEDSIRTRYQNKLERAKGDEKELAKLEKEIADKVKQATKAYTEMNEGDAQGWITFDFYRAASIMEGKWTTKQEKMYNDICNGIPYTPEEVAQFFPTKKYQYWGPIQTKDDQLPVHGFHKFSLLPLIPTVVGDSGKYKDRLTNLGRLHEKMMKQGVDYALFKSGSKIATITNLKYNKEKDNVDAVEDKLYTKDRNFDADSTFVKNTAFFQYLKNQLEIAPKFKRKVTFPTQMRKLIENGLYENGIPLKPEYEQLVLAYEKDLADLTEIKKKKLMKEAGIDEEQFKSGKVVFNEKLRKFLIAELERQDLAEHEIDFIRKAPGKDKLARDLSMSLSSQKLEKILTSIVIKRLVKQKFNGEGLIQVSGAGWETNLRGELTAEEKLKYGTNELPFYRREVLDTDKNGKKIYGKTLAMKVKIALQGDFVKLLGLTHNDKQPIGTIERLNEMLKDEEWLNTGDHRKMISITGPRIPTQENNSMEFAEVYEFLPKEAGNIVVLPSEIVAKSGGDFDIDKITFMMPNIKSSPNFEDIDFKAIGERFPEFGEEGARTIFENRKEEIRSEEEQEVLDAMYESAPRNVTLPFDSTSEAGLENRIIDDMRKILEVKDLYSNLVRPNATDLIEPIARELENSVSDYKPRTVEYTDKKGNIAYRIPGSRVFEIRYNLYKHSSNSIGKQTLGLGAVDNTYNTVFNRIGARFNAGYTTKNNVYRKLDLLLPHNTLPDENGDPTISISHLYDVEGTSISSVIAQMINGWVDIAKDAWIFNVQGNKEIAPTLLFMVQAGIPIRQAVYYVSHPLIRQYVTEQKMAKSIFAKPLGKGEGNPMFAKNHARTQMFKKLYDDKKANDLKSGKALEEHLNKEMQNLLKDPESKAFGFFNSDKVEKNLLDKVKAGDTGTYDEADKAIFLHFLEMEEMAKGLRDIKMSTNVDTSRTNSIYEAETKQAAIDAAEASKMYPGWMIPRIKQESPIGSFFIQEFQIDFLKELFPLKANDIVNNFIRSKTKEKGFKDIVDLTFGETEDLVNTFRNDLPAFIFQNQLRKLAVTDKNEYRGVLLNNKYTVKTTPSLRFGVFAKLVDGKPVIYVDKNQLSNNYKNLGNLDESVKLEDGTVVTPAPVSQSSFDSLEAYAAFLMERELIRMRYTQPGMINQFKERLDFKSTVAKLMSSEPKLIDETDAHFEARINTIAFEQTIRDMALDNTYNMDKLFMSRASVADQLVQIQANYPELMNEYSVLRNLAASFTERGKERVANVMLNDSLLDADKLNIYHQNLQELSNPATIKVDPNIPAEEKLRLTQFFSKFGIYAFLQSGMNTTGRYSLTRLVPQGQFTKLMTTFLQGENVDGVQTPGFIQNINEITLEKYWRKFLKVNDYRNSNRKKFKNYILTPAEGSYNPAADKKTLDKLFPGQEQFNEKTKFAKSYLGTVEEEKPADKKQKPKTEYKPITFSEDANGNQLYDGKQAGLTFATEALKEKPDGMFVINGVASVDNKPPQLGNATTGEATILNASKGANSLNFPVRKAFGTVGFQLTDVTPSGKPVEVKPAEKKSVVDKFAKKNIFTVTPQQGVSDNKAKAKASIATQYIGFGEGIVGKDGKRSSTQIYREQVGTLANTGNYSSNDVIFVSVPGLRGNAEIAKREQDKTIIEAIKAIEAGATILTDNKKYIFDSTYNTGEQRLYDNMKAKGYNYSEITVDGQLIGTWSKASTQAPVSTVKPTIDLSREWRGDLESRPVYTAEGVNTMRSSAANSFENFGNPFSEAGYGGTIKVASIGEAVVAYKEWLLGTNHQDVKPQQREWILDQINQGKLDGATLLYAGKSEARGQGMHPTALAEVVEQLRGTQLMTTPIDTASNVDSTVQTSMKDDSKTIQPVPGNTVNPELAKQIDSMIENMKAIRDSGKTLYFPKTGIGQYMIGADDVTGELPSGKIVPIAPATFVYLSQKLWDNFKYANPNFDVALGYMGMTNVLQTGAEVNDLDVMEALSICFKSIIP